MIWRRLRYYPPYLLGFAVLYGLVIWRWEALPGRILLAILGVSLLKDVVDEALLRRGQDPIAYGTIEHNPSNIVLLTAVAAGYVTFGAPIGGVPRSTIAVAVGGVDLILDGWQDLRAG